MKSILVIGLGRFGRTLSRRFEALGDEVMAVDVSEAAVSAVMNDVTCAKIADCTDENVLRQMGISNFDMCFVCIGSDFSSSLMVTALLKDHGAKYVCSKAASEIHEKLLLRTGADRVVYPERENAERLATLMSNDSVFDRIELTEDYAIYDLPVPQQWIGHTPRELQIRGKWRLNVLATKIGSAVHPMPGADYAFDAQDHILAMSSTEDMRLFLKKFFPD